MRISTGFLVLLVLLATPLAAFAQPFIQVYYDEALSQTNEVCRGVGLLDTVYVALLNANAMVSGAEYSIEYPPEVTWLADFDGPPVTLGNTPFGIAMGWGTPQNGFFPIVMHKILVQWNCDFCIEINKNQFRVIRHPSTGSVTPMITDWPNFDLISANGRDTQACWIVATEQTTWGRVKSLYAE